MNEETGHDALIVADSLGLEYRKGRKAHRAFADIDFSIRKGEFVTVVGPSGCGKTSLLYILAGLVKASSGEVRMRGTPIRSISRDRGLVFQDFALFPWLSVRKNIEFGIKRQPKRERTETVKRLVSLVGLSGFESYLPHQLSGGMQQRAAVASGLATDPEVLLMDEPFGALDAQTRRELQDEVSNIHTSTGTTIVFVTHDIREAVLLADRVLVMGGRPARIMADIPVLVGRPREDIDPGVALLCDQIRLKITEARAENG